MSAKRRVAIPLACAGFLGAFGLALVLSHSHASARKPLTYSHLANIQKRIISSTLLSAIGPRTRTAKPRFVGGDDEGGGPDGAPFTPPKSFELRHRGQTGAGNYFPTSQGQCSSNLGANVKVNQNCLNVSDPDLQGRGQANNETSIAQDPNEHASHRRQRQQLHPRRRDVRRALLARRRQELGGLHGARTASREAILSDSPRQYWQAGGDTSVAWDTRGNAYLSCQLFNRGTVASPNPDQSSAFVIFRSTQNDGASWNFPGRYTTVFNDTAGTGDGARGQGADDRRQQRAQPVPRPHLRHAGPSSRPTARPTSTRSTPTTTARRSATRSLVSKDSAGLHEHLRPRDSQRHLQREPVLGSVRRPRRQPVRRLRQLQQPAAPAASDNHYQVLLAKSTDGGQTFSSPVKVSDYYDLPDCDTYQGDGADPVRACVPEKGSSTVSVFRATNYPSGQVDPTNRQARDGHVRLVHQQGLQRDQRVRAGRLRRRRRPDSTPASRRRVRATTRSCWRVQQRWVVVRQLDRHDAFDPRNETVVNQSRGQNGTDQFWQWSAFTQQGPAGRRLLRPPVRPRRDQRVVGLQPVRQPGPVELRPGPRHVELDAGADAVRGPERAASSTATTSGWPRSTRHTRSGRTRGRRTCSCVRAAPRRASRRPCAGRRSTTARPRTTRRASPTTVSVPSSGGHGH